MATSGKLLVTGHLGQLGSDLMALLGRRYTVVGLDLPEFDLCNRDATVGKISAENPAVVLHSAAYTDVDACESNQTTAIAVNGEGTRNVAIACRESGARMIYYSTDYVFDGTKATAYVEDDPTVPNTVYGRSKLIGEEAVADTLEDYAILRIAWVYGRTGKNFVKTMVRLGLGQLAKSETGEEVPPIKVVDDQVGNPTWTEEVVAQTEALLDPSYRGIFHATATGEVSWYRFARRIFEELGLQVRVEPCTTSEFPRPAPRPARSSLENRRLKEAGADRMRDWDVALTGFLEAYGKDLLP